MAIADQSDGEPDAEQEHDCDYNSAREYVENRLQELDEPITPSDLADEYDCSSAHMRHTLRDLLDDGEAERVGHGEYVAADAGEDTETPTETHGFEQGSEATNGDVADDTETMPEGTPEDMPPSLAGGPLSADPDGPGTDPAETDEIGYDLDEQFETIGQNFRTLAGRLDDVEARLDAIEAQDDGDTHDDRDDSDVIEADDHDESEDSEPPGMPGIPVSAVLVVAVVVAGGYWWVSRKKKKAKQQQEQQQQSQQPAQPPSGGLLGD